MRKRSRVVAAAVLLLLPAVINKANPIIEGYLNELLFDTGGWRLEMHVQASGTLDGWSLSSRSGRAFFKSGIHLGGAYRVITPESLLSPLAINPLGDSLVVHSPSFPMALFLFGSGGMVAAPRSGQSMCLRETGSQFYYLDNTPTLGLQNDALNATGVVRGRILDSLGRPVSAVRVSWGEPASVYSDTGGNFSFTEFARRLSLTFTHSNFAPSSMPVQVWPESTLVVGVVLTRLVGVEEEGMPLAPAYALHLNYPNPFNPSTIISFQLPRQAHVVLRICDMSGRDVATLVNEVKQPGAYTVRFNGGGLASGIYFCQLRSGSFVAARKLILIR